MTLMQIFAALIGNKSSVPEIKDIQVFAKLLKIPNKYI